MIGWIEVVRKDAPISVRRREMILHERSLQAASTTLFYFLAACIYTIFPTYFTYYLHDTKR